MKGTRIEVERVNIRMQGGRWTPGEAEAIARMMVRHVRDGVSREQGMQPGGGQMERVAPRPVRIGRGTTAEETARMAAAEICRALRES